MLQLPALCQYLDRLLSTVPVTDYAPNGLQVEGRSSVKKIGLAVSSSLATIQAAVDQGVDVLIVHHGLFWQGDSYVIQGIKRQKLALLFEHGLSLIAYHLPLDMHPVVGNNWKAAKDLGWTNLQPFGYVKGIAFGVKGEFPALSREAFQQQLETYYQHPAYCALGGKETIRSAGLISGGAYRQITDAVTENLDAFITGNFDEPVWHQAMEEKINFFALGHSATERIGPIALGQYIEAELGISCCFIDIQNPF